MYIYIYIFSLFKYPMVLIDIQYGLPTKAMVPTVLPKCLALAQPAPDSLSIIFLRAWRT